MDDGKYWLRNLLAPVITAVAYLIWLSVGPDRPEAGVTLAMNHILTTGNMAIALVATALAADLIVLPLLLNYEQRLDQAYWLQVILAAILVPPMASILPGETLLMGLIGLAIFQFVLRVFVDFVHELTRERPVPVSGLAAPAANTA